MALRKILAKLLCHSPEADRCRTLSRVWQVIHFSSAVHHLSPRRVNRLEDEGGLCFLKSCRFSAPFGRLDEDKPSSTARFDRPRIVKEIHSPQRKEENTRHFAISLSWKELFNVPFHCVNQYIGYNLKFFSFETIFAQVFLYNFLSFCVLSSYLILKG